ncbi:GtrA family protein [Sphingomonas antarctica]|uniref:GtrA family protein n=1 Tax=Sphingomonas antarctica TaxID=2040274 RepID=UPI0039EBFA9A
MLSRLLDPLPIPPAHRPLVEQIVRYALVGGFVTAIGTGAYWVWAKYLAYPPLIAGIVAYIVSMALGYILHSRVSFAGHGEGGNDGVRSARFFAVSAVSLGLNELWIWILTGLLHGETWWPIPAMIFVTPAIVFVLNRKWVFA